MDLHNAVVIVTGSSRGVGKGIAIRLAAAGSRVVVTARSETEGPLPGSIRQTAEEIQRAGGLAHPIRADLANDADVGSLVDQTMARFERIDVLVNNHVTVGRPQLFRDMEIENWDYVMRVNFRGPLVTIRAVLPHMLKRGSGVIVNVTSGNAVESHPGVPMPYGVSKAALNRLTTGLAFELRGTGIASITLDPAFTATERVVARAPHVGLDMRNAHPQDYPGRALVHLLSGDPHSHNGKSIYVPDYVKEHGLGG